MNFTIEHYRTRAEVTHLTIEDLSTLNIICNTFNVEFDISIKVWTQAIDVNYIDNYINTLLICRVPVAYFNELDCETCTEDGVFKLAYNAHNHSMIAYITQTNLNVEQSIVSRYMQYILIDYDNYNPEYMLDFFKNPEDIPWLAQIERVHNDTQERENIELLRSVTDNIDLSSIESEVQRCATKVRQLEEQINSAYTEFNKAKQQLAQAKTQTISHPFEVIADLIEGDSDIHLCSVDVENKTFNIRCDCPITYWDMDIVEDNLRSTPHSYDKVVYALRRCLVYRDYTLYISQGITVYPHTFSARNELNADNLPWHMHLGKYGCPGDNIRTYRDTDDYILKYNIIMNTVKQWNLYDTCVYDSFINYLQENSHLKCFKDANGLMHSVDDIWEEHNNNEQIL